MEKEVIEKNKEEMDLGVYIQDTLSPVWLHVQDANEHMNDF